MQATLASETSPPAHTSPPGFCVGCAYVTGCEAGGFGKPELSGLRHLVERTGPLRNGEYLYRPSTPVRALYAVQTGMAKTVMVDIVGREKVLAFHLPGEVIGLDAVCQDQYDSAVVVLGKTRFCKFPFAAIRQLAHRQTDVQWHLMQVLSRQLRQSQLYSGDHPAEERMARFLIDLRDRRAALGLPTERLPLPMSRADIGNHLGLATETVSRLLARFRNQALVRIDRKGLDLLDSVKLRDLKPSPQKH
ncbi:helix-turn-helix domain-containing protein [Rhodanobacter sp. MP7CTX1]|uniref:Crp/Fnr family transcriptional regulator n=1 Tax=Rhodanobacter sp. MP7CTX1 TaxID=2723084 RepID=UPI001615BAB0|nr:helix-turn-helix domain-containing protein [Rhodanobacter sp. MP7CTX1]MBB6188660.1 CRP/FNR family transcriptional regulator [Rhodanobacter sp. MP7CTX1]